MELTDHTSEETAYTVDDYPYGFRARTSIRYWIETKRGFGQRMMAQTMNPTTGRWNKAKGFTYSPCLALVLADNGHVEPRGLRVWATEAEIAAFEAECPSTAAANYGREAIRYARAANRANEHVTVTIHECGTNCTEEHQTLKEQSAMMSGLIRHEMWQDTLAAIRVIA